MAGAAISVKMVGFARLWIHRDSAFCRNFAAGNDGNATPDWQETWHAASLRVLVELMLKIAITENKRFMNKTIFTLAAVMAMCLAACAQNDKGEKSMGNESKPLVVYFSATGTTAQAARTIAEATGGTLREIAPRQAYTAADLDWNDRQSRSSVEMNNPQARPALKDAAADVAAHDVIFIGYPIWWDQAPRVINTFIESHDLKGKTLVPFATSGGSGIANSVKELREAYPGLDWRDGKLLNGASRDAIRQWAGGAAAKR